MSPESLKICYEICSRAIFCMNISDGAGYWNYSIKLIAWLECWEENWNEELISFAENAKDSDDKILRSRLKLTEMRNEMQWINELHEQTNSFQSKFGTKHSNGMQWINCCKIKSDSFQNCHNGNDLFPLLMSVAWPQLKLNWILFVFVWPRLRTFRSAYQQTTEKLDSFYGIYIVKWFLCEKTPK